MSERKIELQGSCLYYEIAGTGGDLSVCVTRFAGSAGEVMIPEQIDGITVTEIGHKAFLGCKTLRRVTLPYTVCKVGDWAFAHCVRLAELRWNGPKQERPICFGRAAFLGCGNLRLLYAKDSLESTAALLAAAVTRMNADYLLDFDTAGSVEWFAKWDARMRTILFTPDSDGFFRQMVCGEEDVGNTDQTAYESAQRCAKVRLLLLRLLYSDGLDRNLRTEAEKYLRRQDETWQVILHEHAEDPAWYRLFAELGCITPENFDAIIADIGEDHPEMKAWFLRRRMDGAGCQTNGQPAADFFDGLEL